MRAKSCARPAPTGIPNPKPAPLDSLGCEVCLPVHLNEDPGRRTVGWIGADAELRGERRTHAQLEFAQGCLIRVHQQATMGRRPVGLLTCACRASGSRVSIMCFKK